MHPARVHSMVRAMAGSDFVARSAWHRLAALGLTLLIGAAGGAGFALFSLPLAWLLGALGATTLASFARLPLHLPAPLRHTMIAVVGVMLGSAFTPERLADAGRWLPSLAALPVYVAVVGVVIFAYIRRFSDFDLKTTFFAAAPGGLGEMIALSDQMGADVRKVSLVHATRLTFIVFTIPWLAAGFGTGAAAPQAGMAASPAPLEILILAVAAVVGFLVAARLRLPAAPFLGPLLGSMLVHLTGWVQGAPPYVLLAIAQVVIGAAVGARFAGIPLALVGRAMLLGAGATLIMLAITAAFAVILTPLTGYGFPLLLLAFIPGGFTEMSLIALAMGVDPAFVVTHHSLRVFLVVSIALPAYVWLDRSGRLTSPADDATEPAD